METRTAANPPVTVSLGHEAGTAGRRTDLDLGVHAARQDMNKIMMAVLQALQDEKERAEGKAVEYGPASI